MSVLLENKVHVEVKVLLEGFNVLPLHLLEH